MSGVYDVTTWSVPGSPGLTAYTDIGAVINSIIADIKAHQPDRTSRPGAVIYIPPGDYVLRTRATVDISYLQIKGSGHGFTSLAIRDGTPDTSGWQELAAGGSHVRVHNTDGNTEAFLVSRGGAPRLSSIEFRDFCLDGVSVPPGRGYANGKVGIRIASDTDALRVTGMGYVYLERALVAEGTDALSVTGNFIAECGSGVELIRSGQTAKIINNAIGAGAAGHSIFAENCDGLLVSGNTIFPDGRSMVFLRTVRRSTVVANKFLSRRGGMVELDGCDHNLVAHNAFRRETAAPSPAGPDDLYGLVHLAGTGNVVAANLFTFDLPQAAVTPPGATPTVVLVASGSGNAISGNHVVGSVPVNSVVLDSSTSRTRVLDSGSAAQVLSYTSDYVLRATP